jgi:transcriptional regulator with XRE-family HTH domain
MIGEQLLRARTGHNLSRAQLSELSGVPKERIRQIEGGANFTTATLMKLLPHLPNLRAIDLGPAELRVAGAEVESVRQELAGFLEAGRRLLTMLERISVVSQEAPVPPARLKPSRIPPELEERLRRLEAQLLAQAPATADQES